MASLTTVRRMTTLVRQWETSADTKAAFVRRHDVSLGTFDYWKRRVRRATGGPDAVGFAPVRLVSESIEQGASRVEVVLTTGERLLVPPSASIDQVRTIVAALRAAC